MSNKSITKNTRKISIVATIIIFLALVRCVSEPFRLQYYSTKALTLVDIKPFLIGSLVTSLALLIMTILSFFNKFKFIIATCILTIVILIIIKRIYLRL